VCHSEIVTSGVGRVDLVIREWRVRIAHDLREGVILHHDHENMIEMGNTLGNLPSSA
jgi:hypothetical protein